MTFDEILHKRAKKHRKNMPDAEIRLWSRLRAHRLCGLKFKRQVVLGNYIVDFVCMEKMLIIELDGSQHAEQVAYDARRTLFLQRLGFQVERFWNNGVLFETNEICDEILRICGMLA